MIASELRESDLRDKERVHSCDPGLIEWYNRPIREVKSVQVAPLRKFGWGI